MTSDTNASSRGLRSWLRDPLIVFVAFAVTIFVADLVFRTSEPTSDGVFDEDSTDDESYTIEITDALVDDLRVQMAAALALDPSSVDVAPAVEDWIETEMLVREAQRRQLDRDDPIVRHRLARKMSFVLDARETPNEPDEATLREAYDAESERYRVAGRYTIRQYYVGGMTEADERRAQTLLAAAESGASPDALRTDSDTPPGGPILRGRTPDRLTQLFGDAFVEGLADATLNSWLLRRSTTGWHVIRVEERELGRTLTFDEARNRVLAGWQREHLAQLREEAIRELRTRYQVSGWDSEATR